MSTEPSRPWRDTHTLTDWEFAEVGKLLCNHDARDLAVMVVRLQGQLETMLELRDSADTARPSAEREETRAALHRELADTKPDIVDEPMTGTEYFLRAIGTVHKPAIHEKYSASHPTTIHTVYAEALTRFPAAADVIAALVFFNAVKRNREAFAENSPNAETTNGA